MNKQKQASENKKVKPAPAQTWQRSGKTEETAVLTPIQPLQRAYEAITPPQATVLQQTIGNQALHRLSIQRKMTLGPVGDKYEHEADAVAKDVVGKLHSAKAPAVAQRQAEEEDVQMKPLPAISSLQRQEEEEELQTDRDPMLAGGKLTNNLENSVQNARSGGQPLNHDVRRPMEQAFNTDFSNVKIHVGGEADRLNRSLSARAFTTGQDIFFRNGEYNPNNNAGQTLLAHELTHTIQQTGSSQMQRQYAYHIQRLPTKKQVVEEDPYKAGKVSLKGSFNNSTYKQILTLLVKFHTKDKTKEQKIETLNDLLSTTKNWLSAHFETGDEPSSARRNALEQLAKDIEEEMTNMGDEFTYNFADTQAEPDTFKFTIAALRKSKFYLPFQKMRYEVEKQFKEKKKGLEGKERQSVNLQIKNETAKKLVGQMREEDTLQTELERIKNEDEWGMSDEDAIEDLLTEMKQTGQDAIGHTWVKFNAYAKSNLSQFYSFGFYPEGGFTDSTKAVAGDVKSPDSAHEPYGSQGKDGERIYLEAQVKPAAYNKALSKAREKQKAPPSYTLFGYNCTAFAKEIAKEAGVSLPKQADVFPDVSLLDKMIEEKYPNPDQVFAVLEAKLKKHSKGVTQTPGSDQEATFESPESKSKKFEQEAVSLAELGTDSVIEDQIITFITDAQNAIEDETTDEQYIQAGSMSLYVSLESIGAFLAKSEEGPEKALSEIMKKAGIPYHSMFDDFKAAMRRIFLSFIESYTSSLENISKNPQLSKKFNEVSSVPIETLLKT